MTNEQSGSTAPRQTQRFAWLARSRDGALALGVLAILALMVLPIPPFALDILISFNLAASVALLLLTLYIRTPLHLSTFPTLLLFTTLLRLALNIASTKQILLHAHAGKVIDAFGHLIVGGNVVVGLVVFVIIAVVQFIVIAKGAERVAEVGARFSLDAMPGKQLSIDADLRNGMIDQAEARRRRSLLEQESQLHGAMDGAMKFVKGDAIAGLIIALVNIVAGVSIGALMLDLAFVDSLQRYTVLTVGDAMVSQIPSLLVSVAAGILITRVSAQDEGGHLGQEIARQVMAHPLALLMTGAILLGFALVPGFPHLPFLFLAVVAIALGYPLVRRLGDQRSSRWANHLVHSTDATSGVPLFVGDGVDGTVRPLTLQVSASLLESIDPRVLSVALAVQRRALLDDLGIPFSGLQVRASTMLTGNRFRLLVNDVEVLAGERGGARAQFGKCADPADLPADAEAIAWGWWVRWDDGVSTRSSESFDALLAALIADAVRLNAGQMIGFQEVQRMLAAAEPQLPELVREVQKAVPIVRISEVMRRLVDEGLPILNLRVILESLLNWAPKEKDVVLLTEHVRVDLGRLIARRHTDENGVIRALALDPATEERIGSAVQQNLRGSYVAVRPDEIQALLEGIERALRTGQDGERAVAIVTTMQVRRYIRRMIAARFPLLPALSYEELGSHAQLRMLGTLKME